MARNMTCILCPRGCALSVSDNLTVTGNACPRGEKYAIDECTHPVRTVTATVRVANRNNLMLSVKTEQPIPKENMMDVMAVLRAITVNAPVARGAVIVTDIFGTKIIATQKVD